jgi:hypothetical protein
MLPMEFPENHPLLYYFQVEELQHNNPAPTKSEEGITAI